jgi:hypothetical protein
MTSFSVIIFRIALSILLFGLSFVSALVPGLLREYGEGFFLLNVFASAGILMGLSLGSKEVNNDQGEYQNLTFVFLLSFLLMIAAEKITLPDCFDTCKPSFSYQPVSLLNTNDDDYDDDNEGDNFELISNNNIIECASNDNIDNDLEIGNNNNNKEEEEVDDDDDRILEDNPLISEHHNHNISNRLNNHRFIPIIALIIAASNSLLEGIYVGSQTHSNYGIMLRVFIKQSLTSYTFGAMLEYFHAPKSSFLSFIVTYSASVPIGIGIGTIITAILTSLNNSDHRLLLLYKSLKVSMMWSQVIAGGVYLYISAMHLLPIQMKSALFAETSHYRNETICKVVTIFFGYILASFACIYFVF